MVGIGTTHPTQRLTLGSGNVVLPTAKAGVDGNLYFGGTTDTGQIGLRLFGGNINSQLQGGFIDVRAGTPTDGLRFRVDTDRGGVERMRITADGNVGIGTPNPTQQLTLGSGNIFLPTANDKIDGNLYFGGTTDTGQIGLRLFGGNVNGQIPSGFIDVRAGTPTDGLIFRVDTFFGGTERMRITAEGNVVVNGDIVLTNADCAEDFNISGGELVEPGTVVVIGDQDTLHPSEHAYDKRVAGVISGAGDCKPGIVLDKQPSQGNRSPVALLGKVFCKVDARSGSIEVGDLLTTSDTPGHAMKATDPFKAFGSVIGKALRPLRERQGLIPILIALQ